MTPYSLSCVKSTEAQRTQIDLRCYLHPLFSYFTVAAKLTVLALTLSDIANELSSFLCE